MKFLFKNLLIALSFLLYTTTAQAFLQGTYTGSGYTVTVNSTGLVTSVAIQKTIYGEWHDDYIGTSSDHTPISTTINATSFSTNTTSSFIGNGNINSSTTWQFNGSLLVAAYPYAITLTQRLSYYGHWTTGYVSDSNSDVITLFHNTLVNDDSVPPTITSFVIPPSSTSLNVSITSFTASETPSYGIVYYLLTESSTAPAANNASWSLTPPTTYTFASGGSKTLYAWTKDLKGNISASAHASVNLPTNGACGYFNGKTIDFTPDFSLCATGSTESAVTGNGPWSWTCSGTNGGTVANCSANATLINGTCGSSNGRTQNTAPTINLCTTGTESSVTGNGPWNWTCNGRYGGSTANCSANTTAVLTNGTCGSSNGGSFRTSPTTHLCTTGTATGVTGTGPWSWSCTGSNGGQSASCITNSPAIDAVCGSASGTSVLTAPTTNFCTVGTTSGISGAGPWTWLCNSNNGGFEAFCIANLLQTSTRDIYGKATLNCSGSVPSALTQDFPPNHANFTMDLAANAACTISPLPGFILIGVSGCQGSLNGGIFSAAASTVPCTVSGDVYDASNGACGTANGTSIPAIPSIGLCANGIASSIIGTGPWNWTCDSSSGGTTASCMAYLQTASAANTTFNPVSGSVTIPALQIAGDTSGAVYSVEMQQTQGVVFSVTSVASTTTAASSATASYNAATGAVHIPELTIASDTSGTSYSIDMQQGQGSSFTVNAINGVSINNGGTQTAPTITDPTTGMVLLRVTGGTYTMGDTIGCGGSDEQPTHQVTLGDFYIGRYEVTQGEWQSVMGSNPSNFTSCGPTCPVEQVSWNEVQTFVATLNQRSGANYRLPTEAEWEYAARSGGQNQRYSGGDDYNAVSWYLSNSGNTTHPVGTKQPNGLGLYDMSGNVWEWVSDWFGLYSGAAQTNPTGISTGTSRIGRGGCYLNSVDGIRPSKRSYSPPEGLSRNTGFRLAAPAQ